jgi:hypothetical protein
MDVVEALNEHSLVQTEEPHAEHLRFTVFESIREYAIEKMRQEGAVRGPDGATCTGESAWADLRQRHAAHYAELGAVDALDGLRTHGGVTRQRSLALELENLMAAADASIAAQVPSVAAHCALGALAVLELMGPFSTGVSLVDRALGQDGLPALDALRLSLRRGKLLGYTGQGGEGLAVLAVCGRSPRRVGEHPSLWRGVGSGTRSLRCGAGSLWRCG